MITTLSCWSSGYSSLEQKSDTAVVHGDKITGWKRLLLSILILSAPLLFLLNVLVRAYDSLTPLPDTSPVHCDRLSMRREWRQLTLEERSEYIRAVQCLRTIPSRLGLNQTLYDDFPWVHSRIGNYSHETAGFLSWHRYFIHIYEQTLRSKCNYNGYLTYWDWTLDWRNLSASPIWSPTTGFGGDGGIGRPTTVGNGRCIVDGPFAGLQALYYDGDSIPHCLSRGFNSGEEMFEKCTRNIKPDLVQDVLDEDVYGRFNIRLEHGPHIAIPYGVRGDFMIFTAPYDPVFFLHHTQLDRLWWIWQHENLEERLLEYNELEGSGKKASLEDVLDLGDFAPEARVKDIMNTEAGLLCYQY